MTELDLLCECISTEGEAEGGGVKFIYMDEGTVYRFENNRMKKIGKQLISKAKREIVKRQKIPQQSQPRNEINDDANDSGDDEPKTRAKRKKQKTEKHTKPIVIDDSEDDEEDADELTEQPEPPRQMKAKRSKQVKRERIQNDVLTPSIDLDEYYSNKHKMEYMTNEITRLNGKISKLKQYKSIVNKLTGGEIDDLPQNTQRMEQDNSAKTKSNVNDSLFMF